MVARYSHCVAVLSQTCWHGQKESLWMVLALIPSHEAVIQSTRAIQSCTVLCLIV